MSTIREQLQRIAESLEKIEHDGDRTVRVTIRIARADTVTVDATILGEMRRGLRALFDDAEHVSHSWGGQRRVRLNALRAWIKSKTRKELDARQLARLARRFKLRTEFAGGVTYICDDQAARTFMAARRSPVR